MVNHNRPDSSKEIVLRFGLLIEAYLEKIKDNFKQPIKDGFSFFQPPKGDDK